MTRYGSVIQIQEGKLEEYKALHAAVWPEVLKTIYKCNIRNYSIFYRDGYLFSYFQYIGDDYQVDMDKMARDPKTQEWWSLCIPCQKKIKTANQEEWWALMEEVFHVD